MAWTPADVDVLKAAIATGIRTVTYSDRTITYQSTEDMLRALSVMEPAASQSDASASGSRFSRAAFSRE